MSRSEIYDVLYAEVIAASKALEKAKGVPAPAHDAARAALETAVRRYTDFSMDGKIPDDLIPVESVRAASLQSLG